MEISLGQRLACLLYTSILAGDLSAASLAADEVEGYERVWGLRLLAAPSVAQMRRAIAGTSEGDAYGA